MAEHTEQSGDRTYNATPLRLAEARRRGQVPRSHELTSTLLMLGGLALVSLLGPAILKSLVGMVSAMLAGGPAGACDMSAVGGLVKSSAASLVWLLAVLAGTLVVMAVVVNMAQVGMLSCGELVSPDWRRVSAAEGLKRFWSVRTLERCGLLLARMAAVGAVAFFTIRSSLPRIASAGHVDASNMLSEAGALVWQLAVRAGAALLVLGVLDYLYQRWQHARDLRITHRELRDDLRQMEGDATVRRRRAGLAASMGKRNSLGTAIATGNDPAITGASDV